MDHPKSAPSRIIGRYAIFDAIAAGGMATVHYGRMVGGAGFTKTVAVKRLHAQYALDPEFHTMFVDEARLAARIQHPNAVGTLDVVDLDGELFLIMEYVAGEALSRLMRDARTKEERIPAKIVGSIISGALYGLHAAHEAPDEHGEPLEIVHRDVSPHNIMIGKEGIPRVLDFGIAKAAGRMQNTREGQIKGKMSYMAPEQIASEPIDRRADIYSAGVVLWEALCGKRLFDGESQAAIMAKVVAGVVTPPSEIRDDLPKSVDAVIVKALARNPFDRYSTARELATAIEESLGVASPGVVGDWVARFAGSALNMREGRVKEIETLSSARLNVPAAAISTRGGSNPEFTPEDFENTSSLPDDDGPTKIEEKQSVPSSTLTERSNVTMASNSDPPKSRGKWLWVAAVLALLVVGVITLTRSSDPETTADRPEASSPVADESADGSPEVASGSQAEVPPEATAAETDASAEPETDASAEATATAAVAPPIAPRPTPRPPSTTKKTPKPKKNCDPPYYFDQDGVKRFKVECL